MKKEFSTHWKSSKQPRKQRKYKAKAPIHIKRKLLNITLSKELREKHGRRNMTPRKGDKVDILKGKYKGKSGKISQIRVKLGKIYIENMQVKKQEGSKVNVPFRPANLRITDLDLEDKKRIKATIKNTKTKTTSKESPKKDTNKK